MRTTRGVQRSALTGILSLLLFAAGCRDVLEPPLQPEAPGASSASSRGQNGPLSQMPEMREQVEAVVVDLPAERPLWETDDQALIEAVRAAEGRVYIGFKHPTDAPTRQTGIVPGITRSRAMEGRAAVMGRGANIVRTYVNSSTVVAVIRPELAPVLRRLPIVNYLEPAATGRIAAEYPPQDTTWGARKVRAPEAWAWTAASGSVVWGQGAWITILDSGVDWDHLMMGDGPARMGFSECWYTPTATITGCFDDNGHGTHVAGIAAAINDGNGFIGIAHYPRGVSSVKVCDRLGNCRYEDVAGGLDWSATNGKVRQIVNMSLGFIEHRTILSEYVARSANAGNLLVAAAGNNYSTARVLYPADYSQVIAVSGTMPNDAHAGWMTCPNEVTPYTTRSNFGANVELSAPFYAKSSWLNLTYQTHCGTSMAAPVVTGVAALVWTKWPTWTANDVRNRLRSTAVDLGPAGRDANFGFGRVDAVRALGVTDPYQLQVSISGPAFITTEGMYSWTASASGGNGSGSYAYTWYITTSGGYRYYAGTGPTYSQYVGSWDDRTFTLEVEVASGSQTAGSSMVVLNRTGSTCGGGRLCDQIEA